MGSLRSTNARRTPHVSISKSTTGSYPQVNSKHQARTGVAQTRINTLPGNNRSQMGRRTSATLHPATLKIIPAGTRRTPQVQEREISMTDLKNAEIILSFPQKPIVVLCKTCRIVAKKVEHPRTKPLVRRPNCGHTDTYTTFQAHLGHLMVNHNPELQTLFPNNLTEPPPWNFTIEFE